MPKEKKVTRVKIGDVVTMIDGEQITVHGYIISEYMPTEDQLRAIIAPLYPAGADVKVCRFRAIAHYVDVGKESHYGGDSIFWGT